MSGMYVNFVATTFIFIRKFKESWCRNAASQLGTQTLKQLMCKRWLSEGKVGGKDR
jgi:hypothetical protein